MRRTVSLFLVALVACVHQTQIEDTVDPEMEIRRLLAPAPELGVAPLLAVEILVLASDTLETLVQVEELPSGELRAVVTHADTIPLWDQVERGGMTISSAHEPNVNIRRWTITDEAIVRRNLESFKQIRVALVPDNSVILHGVKFIGTAKAGASATRLETFVEHPSGSAHSGPPNELSEEVGEWVLRTLADLHVQAFVPKWTCATVLQHLYLFTGLDGRTEIGRKSVGEWRDGRD